MDKRTQVIGKRNKGILFAWKSSKLKEINKTYCALKPS